MNELCSSTEATECYKVVDDANSLRVQINFEILMTWRDKVVEGTDDNTMFDELASAFHDIDRVSLGLRTSKVLSLCLHK